MVFFSRLLFKKTCCFFTRYQNICFFMTTKHLLYKLLCPFVHSWFFMLRYVVVILLHIYTQMIIKGREQKMAIFITSHIISRIKYKKVFKIPLSVVCLKTLSVSQDLIKVPKYPKFESEFMREHFGTINYLQSSVHSLHDNYTSIIQRIRSNI